MKGEGVDFVAEFAKRRGCSGPRLRAVMKLLGLQPSAPDHRSAYLLADTVVSFGIGLIEPVGQRFSFATERGLPDAVVAVLVPFSDQDGLADILAIDMTGEADGAGADSAQGWWCLFESLPFTGPFRIEQTEKHGRVLRVYATPQAWLGDYITRMCAWVGNGCMHPEPSLADATLVLDWHALDPEPWGDFCNSFDTLVVMDDPARAAWFGRRMEAAYKIRKKPPLVLAPKNSAVLAPKVGSRVA